MHALIITWDHPLDCVSGIAELIADGLRENGAKVDIINRDQQKDIELLWDLINKNNIDLILGMSPYSLNFFLNGKKLFQHLNCTYAVFFMDNPVYFCEIIEALLPDMPSESLFIFCDARHEKNMREYLDLQHCNQFTTMFLPYGTTPSYRTSRIHTEDKIYDLTIFATLDQQISDYVHSQYDYKENVCFPEEMRMVYGSRLQNIAELIVHYSKSDFNVDVYTVLQSLISVGKLGEDSCFIKLYQIVDSYIKRYRRYNLATKLLDVSNKCNYKIKLFGTGWQHLNISYQNVEFAGPVRYKKQFEIYNQSKVAFNSDPNWTFGVHDRVFNAVSSGCAVLTNQNLFTDTYFTNGMNCGIYNNVNKLEDVLVETVSNWKSLMDYANNSILPTHTWRSRTVSLIEYVLNKSGS